MKTLRYGVLVAVWIGMAGCAHDHGRVGPGPDERPWRSLVIEALDANHDGVIDSNEITNASSALLKLDTNHDGKLDYDEIHRPKERVVVEGPEPIVQVLDANHDDVIDAAEIANAPAALKKLDKNGDGQLTPDEYSPVPPLIPHDHGPQAGPNGGGESRHHLHGGSDSAALAGSASGH